MLYEVAGLVSGWLQAFVVAAVTDVIEHPLTLVWKLPSLYAGFFAVRGVLRHAGWLIKGASDGTGLTAWLNKPSKRARRAAELAAQKVEMNDLRLVVGKMARQLDQLAPLAAKTAPPHSHLLCGAQPPPLQPAAYPLGDG